MIYSLSVPVEQVGLIRHAMSLTTEAQQNITAAHYAISLWSDILENEHVLDPQVIILCNSLYASALCRSGDDPRAIQIYDKIISLIDEYNRNSKLISSSVVADVRLGRGSALQRSMRYNDARTDFSYVCDTIPYRPNLKEKIETSAFKAALCCLRMGDNLSAEKILQDFLESQDRTSVDPNLVAFSASLQLYENEDAIKDLEMVVSQEKISPVFKWIYALFKNEDCNIISKDMNHDDLIHLASVNLSPFDDHRLLLLDDKVNLHDLLTNCTSRPNGLILPRDIYHLTEKSWHGSLWMWKERSGYGSHGNHIISTEEAIRDGTNLNRLVLCQELIDSSMLCNGRKFSVRIYVVYFPYGSVGSSEVGKTYLLKEGLMKLAKENYFKNHSNICDEDMFMTNSGRLERDGMTQYDLEYLKRYMNHNVGLGSFIKLWDKIRISVKEVMSSYHNQINDKPFPRTISKMNIPKIMGFDYIISDIYDPYLLEVNRFPGLEPRGETDRNVKKAVILSAWKLASQLSGINCGLKDLESSEAEEISQKDNT